MKKLLLIPALLLISLSTFAHDIFNAVKTDDLAAVKYLLSKGADLDHVNTKGETVLIVAALNNNNRMCDFLVEMNANIDVRDAKGNSALMYAIEMKNYDLVQMLIHHGAKTNQTNHSGQSALDLARMLHDANLIRLIAA